MPTSITDGIRAGSPDVTPSQRATGSIVVPCRIVERTTAKNTMLKYSSERGTPSRIGNVASTTGTAPRRPAQPMSACSRRLNRAPTSEITVASGRLTKTTSSASSVPFQATSGSSDGKTSRPSVRNMPSCATQASPSWNAVTVRLAGRLPEPSASPVR